MLGDIYMSRHNVTHGCEIDKAGLGTSQRPLADPYSAETRRDDWPSSIGWPLPRMACRTIVGTAGQSDSRGLFLVAKTGWRTGWHHCGHLGVDTLP